MRSPSATREARGQQANKIDITICRKCGGRMRILEVVSDPDDIARVLHGARAPPPPPRSHPPGQLLTEAADVSPRPRRLAWAGLLARVFEVAAVRGRSWNCASRPRDAGTIRDKRRWEAPLPAHAPVQTDPTPNQESAHVAA